MSGDELQEVEELEELEELEEVSELENVTFTLQDTSTKIWSESYKKSPSPSILLDKNLQIIWKNEAFDELFGDTERCIGMTLATYHSNFLHQNTLKEIIKSLNSKERGFSWYGKIERKNKEQLSVITKLLIVPLFSSDENGEKPIAFGCIYNDISGEYRELLKNTFKSLLEAARLKDNDTGNHIERVNRYSKKLAETLLNNQEYPQVDNEFIQNIGYLAAMHDVGKIGTPDDILNKKGPLEDWEWEIMKEHTINGAYILSTYPNPMAREIALRHHEWWNGNGYPHGLTGEFIPLSARIVTIADVYDALRMERTYKKSFPHTKARDIIIEEKGTHFDPKLVDKFLEIEEEFKNIFDTLND